MLPWGSFPSTWYTPQSCRGAEGKRSLSCTEPERSPGPVVVPRSSGRSCSTSGSSGVAVLQPKGRSFSTTAIPSSALCRRGVRERKTVCSLHPLTLGAQAADDRDDEDPAPLLPPPLPSLRRLHTSDYDSSNDSPSGSETNDPAAATATQQGNHVPRFLCRYHLYSVSSRPRPLCEAANQVESCLCVCYQLVN